MVSESFLMKVAMFEKMKRAAYAKKAPTPSAYMRQKKLITPIRKIVRTEAAKIARDKATMQPSPVSWLEMLSPAYLFHKRGLSPLGAFDILFLKEGDEQRQGLLDFGGAIGAVTPEGKITEMGRQIADIGGTAQTIGGTLGKLGDFKTWAIIGLGAIAAIMLLRR